MNITLEVLILFAHEDRDLFLQLKNHLAILEKKGFIRIWDEEQIVGGITRKQVISSHLQKASLILLLISSNFMASNECSALAQKALEMYMPPEKYVVPVLLHEVDWEASDDIGQLAPLPGNRVPISSWPNPHAAYTNVGKGIRAIVEEYQQSQIEKLKSFTLLLSAPDGNKYMADVSADMFVDQLLRDFLNQWPGFGNTGSMHFSLYKDAVTHPLDPANTLREAGLVAGSNLRLVSEALGPKEAVNLTIEDDQGEHYATTVLLHTSVSQLAYDFLHTTGSNKGEVVAKWIVSSTHTQQLRLAESLFSQGVCDGALLRIYCIATAVEE